MSNKIIVDSEIPDCNMFADILTKTVFYIWYTLYVEEIYDEDMALKQLEFSKSNNQVLLHTSKALSKLEFIGRDEYEKQIFI